MPATDIDYALSRVQDFVTRSLEAGVAASTLAELADVDNKSVALAVQPNWNPTANTVRKLETLLPKGWRKGDPLPPRKARAA